MFRKRLYLVCALIFSSINIIAQKNDNKIGFILDGLITPALYSKIGEQKIYIDGDSTSICISNKEDTCFNRVRYKVTDKYGSCIVLCVNDEKKLKVKFYYSSSKQMLKVWKVNVFGPGGKLINVRSAKAYYPRLQKIERLNYDGRFDDL
ncbi:hypothetical protein [Ferruginibacter sp.]